LFSVQQRKLKEFRMTILEYAKKAIYPANDFGLDNEKNRKAWLAKVLGKLPQSTKLLDAGAGELGNKKYCTHIEYVSQDICQYDGKGDGQGMHTKAWDTSKIDIVSDITEIPVSDGSFDAVLCSEVMEHLSDPNAALIEFKRILKKGGVLIITAPFNSLTHFAPYHFATGFNSYYFNHYLSKLDFEIVEITANGNFFSYVAQELFRVPQMAEEYTGKRLGIIKKILLLICIRMLAKISSNDKESSKVLCYGYHVIARKK